MPKITDLIGQKYGRLKPIEFTGKLKDRSAIWKCQCDCGKIHYASSRDLRQNHTKSCGCLVHERIPFNKLRPYEAIFNRIKIAASHRKLNSKLTYEQFLEFTHNKECHYCGINIKWLPYAHENNKTSVPYYLDRKDNDLGYSKENCVVCCTRCNWCKSDKFSYQEWKEIGSLLKAVRENKNYAYIHKN